MPFWYFLFAAGMAAVGLICWFKPEDIWELREGWKSYSAADPSDFYIRSTKLGGVLLVLGGIALAGLTVYTMLTGQI